MARVCRMNVTLRQTLGVAAPLEAMKATGDTGVDTTLIYTLLDPERDRHEVHAMYDYIIGTGATKE